MFVGRKMVWCLMIAVLFLLPISAVTNEITKTDLEEHTGLSQMPKGTICMKENYDDDPEITDEEGDTRFDYVDVVWASFYENPDEPEYLFAALKIANLQDAIGCVYAIHWDYNDAHYYVAFRNGVLFPPHEFKSWQCGFHWLRAAIDTWDDSLNSGFFNLETGIITWRVHKNCLDDPQQGDVLTQSYVFTAQRISKLGLIPLRNLFRSFSDSTDATESMEYIIQY
ncbi:MAG: hypothetical protein JRJ39_14495 [Deltaproteobacteria bacterium]|nr:hypothetical protein [Deltaproteobacteria bacterium]